MLRFPDSLPSCDTTESKRPRRALWLATQTPGTWPVSLWNSSSSATLRAPVTGFITGYAGAQARTHFFLGGEIRIQLVRFILDLRMFSGWDYSCPSQIIGPEAFMRVRPMRVARVDSAWDARNLCRYLPPGHPKRRVLVHKSPRCRDQYLGYYCRVSNPMSRVSSWSSPFGLQSARRIP